jgi:glucokinase
MENDILIGVDIGGTKISAGRVESGVVTQRNHFENPAKESSEVIYNVLVKAVEEVITERTVGIGIGVPGLIDVENGIISDLSNIPSWNNYPLKEKIENHFGKPVFLNNDANCYAVGEKYFGEGRGYENIVALTLGTGLGAGIIVNGRLSSGKNGGTGELCVVKYKDSNLEAYCGGKFFTTNYKTDAYQLSKAAHQGDVKAQEAFKAYGRHLGEAIYTVLATLDPDIIILGGSIANAFSFFEKEMYKVISAYPVQKVVQDVVIKVGSLTDSAILGAAALFYDNDGKSG